MKKIKLKRWQKRLLAALLVFLTIYIFKGSIYRTCFSYELERPRTIKIISSHEPPSKADKTISEIISSSLENSSKLLSFTTEHCTTDAHELVKGGKTNCIGYANLCAFFCNDGFSENGFYNSYKAETYVAQIYFFGYNIHHLFSSPFWKDHDVVVVTDLQSGEKIILDPTLYDYAGIGIVRERK